MSLSHETMLELMSLADGELEGPDRERVERLVATNDEARAIVASVGGAAVGSWLASAMDERAAASGADGVADAVMASIAGTGARAASNGVAEVASMGQARARRASRVQVVVSATAAVFALAAGVALYVRSGVGHVDDRAPVASVRTPPVDMIPPTSVAQVGGGVEVNEIDAPSREVSVFEIPVGAAAAVAGSSSVVVWVDDDPGSP